MPPRRRRRLEPRFERFNNRVRDDDFNPVERRADNPPVFADNDLGVQQIKIIFIPCLAYVHKTTIIHRSSWAMMLSFLVI